HLVGLRVERDLPAAEDQPTGHHGLRIGTDGLGRIGGRDHSTVGAHAPTIDSSRTNWKRLSPTKRWSLFCDDPLHLPRAFDKRFAGSYGRLTQRKSAIFTRWRP